MSDKTLYVVSGYMRTGTSMMMKALEASGLEAVYNESREKMRKHYMDQEYDPNVGGLYELSREQYRTRDFPREYEGKLIKCLSYGVIRMRVMGHGIRIVLMRRDIEEIRQSYMAFFGSELKNSGQVDERMEEVIEMINNRKDVLSLDVFWYRELIENPRKYFNILKEHGWKINVDDAIKIVNPKLCR